MADDVINRLKSVRGHVNGIIGMVENDAGCVDVVTQIKAVQSALQQINLILLDRHLHTCLISAVQSQEPDKQETALQQIRHLFAAREKFS